MAVALVYNPVQQFADSNGNPVPFARVFAFAAGTSTPLSLYADSAGATPLVHGVQADGGGRLTAYMTVGTAYKVNVLDTNFAQVSGWPIDNILVTPTGNPALIDDFSADLTQSGLQMDPGESGSFVLPQSLADELKQLRFRIAEMTGAGDHRTTYATRTLNGLQLITLLGTDVPGLYPPSVTTTQFYTFVIPDGWQPQSNMTWVFYRKTTSGAGTAIMNMAVNRERDTQAAANIVTTTAINFLPGNGFSHKTTVTIPGSGLLAGDIVLLTLQRVGGGPDTDAGNIIISNSHVVYTGVGSR